MKQIRFLMLLLLVLCAMPYVLGVADTEEVLPTPLPWVLEEGGIPVFERYTEGIDLQSWMENFTLYCERQNIPRESHNFLHVDEFIEKEGSAVGRSFGVYRLLVGGAELFLYSVDGDTAISFYVTLDDIGMRRYAMRDALLAYFPLVMRACIYASEGGGVTEEDLNRIMARYGDIAGMIQAEDTPWTIRDTLNQGWYEFESHARFYECTGFGGQWQEYPDGKA